ncbi:MAG TPA: hypothetical protein VE360_16445, partial [Pyrinomonadaceae bacterium]|nr:hypothetical protein [Pyrinomonadaceae bacterium]
MSQASLPRKANDNPAARRQQVSWLALAAAAVVLAASFAPAISNHSPGRTGKIPPEQRPPLQNNQPPKEPGQTRPPPQTSLRLSANPNSLTLCPGSPTRVRLVASGHNPGQPPPPFEWDVKGVGNLSGAGASRVWDLSGVKQGVYEATVTL